MTDWLLDAVLGLLLLGLAGGALHVRQLYAGVLLFIAFGLVLALVWARLGAADLAFDDAESCRLLEGLGASLSGDHAAELVARAEGWPVGLYLMTLSLQTRGERAWTDTSVAPSSSEVLAITARSKSPAQASSA